MGSLFISFGLSLLIAGQLRCAKSQQTAVEAIEGDHTRTLPFSFLSLDGRRDGARVDAILVLEHSETGERLRINLGLDLGPPIRLGSGTFQIRESGKMFDGPVSASSLNFQAGQSGGMSLGGRFELLNNRGRTLYRVVLRPTLVDSGFR